MQYKKKAILAFSGGLDTSFCVLWLKNNGFDVETATVDCGGFAKKELDGIGRISRDLGASRHVTLEAKEEFYKKIVTYCIKGNLLRGGVYPLCVGPERIIQAKKIAELAVKENAEYIAHGSTGAGNDQVRFDVAFSIFAPNYKILAPVRDLGITRAQEEKYLQKYGVSIKKNISGYSINRGLLGTTIAGNETKNSWETPPDEIYPVCPIDKTPIDAFDCIISFKQGLPTGVQSLTRQHAYTYPKQTGLKILEHLNKIGAQYGVGRGMHIGTTILGIKGRVAFIAPAMLILIKAHQELEKLVLSRQQLFWKETICGVYANMLHESMYFDPLMRDIEVFINSSQKHVEGQVHVRLWKGNIIIDGYRSNYSLMDSNIAHYGEENSHWAGRDAEGFTKLYGVESKIYHSLLMKGS